MFEGLKPAGERCRNPWNGGCQNTDIQLYIIYRGERLPICARCWSEICESDLEWGEERTGKDEGLKSIEGVIVKCTL